jgi:hypothetical protein
MRASQRRDGPTTPTARRRQRHDDIEDTNDADVPDDTAGPTIPTRRRHRRSVAVGHPTATSAPPIPIRRASARRRPSSGRSPPQPVQCPPATLVRAIAPAPVPHPPANLVRAAALASPACPPGCGPPPRRSPGRTAAPSGPRGPGGGGDGRAGRRCRRWCPHPGSRTARGERWSATRASSSRASGR